MKAGEDLKRLLPSLYVVLARIVCWEARQPFALPDLVAPVTHNSGRDVLVEPVVEDTRDEDVSDNSNRLPIRLELDWTRLEQTFIGATSAAPPRQQYFSYLYYLYPCNTIRFLRGAVSYLNESPLQSPYILEWDKALDEDKIRSKSEVCTFVWYSSSHVYLILAVTTPRTCPASFADLARRSGRARKT